MPSAPPEGYVLHAYGPERYLHHAVASATALRRHDTRRPIALYCPDEHADRLRHHDLDGLFERVEPLPEAHRSIVGFKHHLDRFMPYARTLFVDSDIVWCRSPDAFWRALAPYPFTSTGDAEADIWFGAAKDATVLADLVLRRRARTLRRLGLARLPRVLTAIVFAQDRETTEAVCASARGFLARRDETHFKSRLDEKGRTLESCEWSLALAMSALGLDVFRWFRGAESPLLDYYPRPVTHDADFEHVSYRVWHDRLVYSVQGLPDARLQRALTAALTKLPGRGGFVDTTPVALHFGTLPFKAPFYAFASRVWAEATGASSPGASSPGDSSPGVS